MVGVEIGLCASASLMLCVLGIFCLKYHCHNQIVHVEAPKYEGYIDCPPKYEAQHTTAQYGTAQHSTTQPHYTVQYTDPSTMT